jgi:hypothetical protein
MKITKDIKKRQKNAKIGHLFGIHPLTKRSSKPPNYPTSFPFFSLSLVQTILGMNIIVYLGKVIITILGCVINCKYIFATVSNVDFDD